MLCAKDRYHRLSSTSKKRTDMDPPHAGRSPPREWGLFWRVNKKQKAGVFYFRMFVFPAPRPRIFHRKTGGSSPFPLENWLFWASPPSPQHFRVRNENRPFSFLQFWRIGLPAPAAASGPDPLDMDPPRTGARPPGSGDGAVRSAGGASGALRRF